eukprot:gnl/Chilomastix_caulleri/6191.p2 GENE.gnl/Chilomastix_caulleri/6191~~gnl/Chilomastix_caulleri/6191.p2  ORF type:complete len:59 (+),score=6.59 gnl/Chilomastix_caulleri/6191:336-512(+)
MSSSQAGTDPNDPKRKRPKVMTDTDRDEIIESMVIAVTLALEYDLDDKMESHTSDTKS